MAKLNSEDHKKFDLGAKIVKGGLITATFIGSIFLGKAAIDTNKDNDDSDDDASDEQA